MKIVVCGCSFSSKSNVPGYEGTHWSEVLATKLDAELVNYARQGISNNAIRLQIEEAIKQKPDWVFINATTTDRIEIPTDKRNIAQPELGYDYDLGLANFNYKPDEKTRMVSETIFSIIEWENNHPCRKFLVDKDTRIAVESYASFMYDLSWRIQVDNWVINSGLWKLYDLGIKFIYNQTILNEYKETHGLPKWFTERYFVSNDLSLMSLMRKYEGQFDPGYHTSPEEQVKIAEKYLQMMQEREQLYFKGIN